MNIWIAVATILILVGLISVLKVFIKKKALSALQERKALTDDEIYQRFYATSALEKGAVVELWHEVARVFQAPAEKLRPTDKFGKEIGTYWITSEEIDALSVIAEQRAKQQELRTDLSSIETIDDYVKIFGQNRD